MFGNWLETTQPTTMVELKYEANVVAFFVQGAYVAWKAQ